MIDSRTEFFADQAITTATTTGAVIDVGANRNIGPGKPMWVVVQVQKVLGDSDAAYVVELQTDTTEGSFTDVLASATLAKDAGTRVVIGMPLANKQFLRLVIKGSGGSAYSGTVSAWLTDQEPASWHAYQGV